ncbi:MAG: hypothetical protein LAT63_04040 [Marinobacter sp.]|nr:hypothetical protein [Marinobacter sp.]
MDLEKDFQRLCEAEMALRGERGDFFSRWFGLPFSLRITRIFLRLGLNENHASVAMFLVGITGALLLIFPPWGVLVGALLLLLHHLLDYVDGQLARHHGRSSVRGAVIDRWNHFMVEGMTFPCLALGLYLQNGGAWPWLVVWVLYLWNRFRVLLAQLPANILSDELTGYPELERSMMRRNLLARYGACESVTTEPHQSRQKSARNTKSWRRLASSMRTASTSYNGFTVLLALFALADLMMRASFAVTGTLEVMVCLLAVYAALNLLDYSWTYLRTDRIERDLASRL